MNDIQSFDNVWDALEDDPIKAENMKLRSSLMISITNYIEKAGITQIEAAKLLHITQPRVSALINFVHRAGMHVTLNIAA